MALTEPLMSTLTPLLGVGVGLGVAAEPFPLIEPEAVAVQATRAAVLRQSAIAVKIFFIKLLL